MTRVALYDLPMWQDYVKKLDDRFGQYVLVIICQKCQHKRYADPAALAQLVGWKVVIAELMPRMRCSKCGARGATHRIERQPVDRRRSTH